MEDPGMGVVGVVHTFERPQQPQHIKLQPRPPHSPDLIQLSDSDSNQPIPPPHDCGYTRITTHEYDAEDINTNDLNKNHKSRSPDRSSYRRPSAHSHKASMNAESFTRDDDSEDLEDFEPKPRRRVRALRRTTSGSSDPGLSSPGSASSPGSDSATPTNLLPLEGSNELTPSHRRSSHWHRLVNDEHCHLLGTEEDSSDRHSSNEEDRDDEDQLLQNVQEVCEEEPERSPAASTATLRPDSSSTAGQESSCSSVAHGIPLSGGGSSGTEGIWRISEEQRSYYTQQFRRLQPDLSKVVQGQQAKHFFEKSKLATDQLTRIWHLSDVTQDGALSLPEFLVAMHLVVARRNNVPLPSALPQPLLALLLPSLQQQQQHVMAQQQQKDNAIRRGSSSSGGSSVVSSVPPPSTAAPSLPPSAGELSDKEVVSPSRAKEWTKFVDSPTSTVSSPGLKPVNFDFQRSAVEEDPQILHPKAMRVTPEPGRGDADCAGAAADGQASAYLDSSNFGPTSLPPGGGKMEPPPPPPRPTRTHARSSSLDLNKFQRCGAVQHLGAPPAVPPRTSPGHVSPNKKLVYQRSAGETVTAGDMSCSSSNSAVHYSKLRPALQHQDCVLPTACRDTEHRRASHQQLAPHILPPKQSLPSCVGEQSVVPRASAFEVYRKPGAADAAVTGAEQVAAPSNSREADLLEDVPVPTTTNAAPSHPSLRTGTASIGTKDKKEVCASIKTTRDRNTVLARLNNELNQELAEVIEERIALEMQLEQMKLFNN